MTNDEKQDELNSDFQKTLKTVLECLRLQHKALEGYGRVLDNHEAALTRLMTDDELAATQTARTAMPGLREESGRYRRIGTIVQSGSGRQGELTRHRYEEP